MRTLFWILLSLWTFFSWYYYVCEIKHSCWEDSYLSSNISDIATIPTKPLKFRWSSHQIPLDSGFPELRTAILAQKKKGQILHITGQYFPPEMEEQADYDLGLARAVEVKKMLLEEIPEDQIKTFTAVSTLVDIPSDSLIEAIQFEWVDALITETKQETNQTEEIHHIPPASEEATVSSNTSVAESDYFVKYFPYNQTKMPEEFSNFLDQLADRIINENKKVIIRGHTDSSGDSETNFKVGLRRAKKIRDQLIQRGVAKKSIEPTSDGEDTPIADNKTAEGRQQNRRIEIILE